VPLSRQALAILKQLHNINGNRQYVFAVSRDGQPIARTTIGAALIAMGYKGIHCPHGFRSSFSTMINAEYVGEDENEKRWHNDVVELQLAHLDKSTRGVYMRLGASALWKQRANLMQHWADRIDAMRGDNVVPINQAA
jgi:integrase